MNPPFHHCKNRKASYTERLDRHRSRSKRKSRSFRLRASAEYQYFHRRCAWRYQSPWRKSAVWCRHVYRGRSRKSEASWRARQFHLLWRAQPAVNLRAQRNKTTNRRGNGASVTPWAMQRPFLGLTEAKMLRGDSTLSASQAWPVSTPDDSLPQLIPSTEYLSGTPSRNSVRLRNPVRPPAPS